MKNTNAKLKLTFDFVDIAKMRSRRGFRCEHGKAYYPCSLILLDDNKHRFWSVEHSVVHGGNLFEKP